MEFLLSSSLSLPERAIISGEKQSFNHLNEISKHERRESE
jgi:hypothetical protein